MFRREITHYIIKYNARIDNTIAQIKKNITNMFGGEDPNPYFGRDPLQAIATIELFSGGGEEFVGWIAFYFTDNGRGSSFDPDLHPPVALAYSINRFNDIIEVLRQESPVYVIAEKNPTDGVIAYLETKREKVGEEEGV